MSEATDSGRGQYQSKYTALEVETGMPRLAAMRTCRAMLFAVLAAASCSTGDSPQEADRGNPELRAADSVGLVTSAVLDRAGMLWFGTTERGIFRYDGASFVRFGAAEGLPDDHVSSLAEASDGGLWIGTASGLCRFDGVGFRAIALPPAERGSMPLNPDEVLSLVDDGEGGVWLGTWGGGAYLYDGEGFTSHLADAGAVYEDGLHHNAIQDIVEADNGDLWFASMSHGGVTRYDGRTFETFLPEDGLADDMVFSAYQAPDGALWFGTRNGGVSRYDGESFTTYTVADGLASDNVSCMLQDAKGRMWLGSLARTGPSVRDERGFRPVPAPMDKALGDLRFILEGPDGAIWFGGRHGRLHRLRDGAWTDFSDMQP